MSGSSKPDPDLATLKDDIAALKRDVASLIEHLKAGATGGAQSMAGQLDENVRQQLPRRPSGRALAKAIGRQVEEQPLTALLIALAVGQRRRLLCCRGERPATDERTARACMPVGRAGRRAARSPGSRADGVHRSRHHGRRRLCRRRGGLRSRR